MIRAKANIISKARANTPARAMDNSVARVRVRENAVARATLLPGEGQYFWLGPGPAAL